MKYFCKYSVLDHFCPSQFQKNYRMERNLDTSSCCGQLAQQPGPRKEYHLWNHRGLFTEMKASPPSLPLKWKWVYIIMKEKDLWVLCPLSTLGKMVSCGQPWNGQIWECMHILHSFSMNHSTKDDCVSLWMIEPQLAPRGTSAQSFSASEMEVSWNAIAWNRNTGRVLGYEVIHINLTSICEYAS